MSESGKKIHIRKNGQVENITLYTTTAEAGSPYITSGNGNYGKLGSVGSAGGTSLRLRKNGAVYEAVNFVNIYIIQQIDLLN